MSYQSYLSLLTELLGYTVIQDWYTIYEDLEAEGDISSHIGASLLLTTLSVCVPHHSTP